MINMVKSVFLLKLSYQYNEDFLARIHVIDTNNHNYNTVLTRICVRQEGRCHFCAEKIKDNDTIISKGHSKRSKYFHKECAERIHLL